MSVERDSRGSTLDAGITSMLRNQFIRAAGGHYAGRKDQISTNQLALTTQILRLNFFDCIKTTTVTQIRSWSGAQAAGATPTICKMALWDVAADGALSNGLVTTNDTAMWNSLNGVFTKNLPSSKTLVAGNRYCCGALCVTAAAVPQVLGRAPTFYLTFPDHLTAPQSHGVITAQSDIATSYAAASFGNATGGDQVPMFLLL